MSPDNIWLALHHAQHVTGASDEVIKAFQKAVTKEVDTYGKFPKGFF
jgi:hypothetical protein